MSVETQTQTQTQIQTSRADSGSSSNSGLAHLFSSSSLRIPMEPSFVCWLTLRVAGKEEPARKGCCEEGRPKRKERARQAVRGNKRRPRGRKEEKKFAYLVLGSLFLSFCTRERPNQSNFQLPTSEARAQTQACESGLYRLVSCVSPYLDG